MTQAQIEDHLFTLEYERLQDNEYQDFFKSMTALGMFKKITIGYTDISFFLQDPYDISGPMIRNNRDVYITRLLTMLTGVTDEEIFHIFDVLVDAYGYEITELYTKIWMNFDLSTLANGCIAFFMKNQKNLSTTAEEHLAMRITKLLELGMIDFNTMKKIDKDCISEGYFFFFEMSATSGLTHTFHYAISKELKSDKDYMKEILDNKIINISTWTEGWPAAMYQDFCDKIPGDMEEYYRGKIRIPKGVEISNEDFDYYKFFLDVSDVTKKNLTKDQLIELGSDLDPRDIILSGEFSIKEMGQFGTFSLKLYGAELAQSCLYESEIIANKDIFTPQIINDYHLYISAEGMADLNAHHDTASGRTSESSQILTEASHKTKFDMNYLEYLTDKLDIDQKEQILIMASDNFASGEFKKYATTLRQMFA